MGVLGAGRRMLGLAEPLYIPILRGGNSALVERGSFQSPRSAHSCCKLAPVLPPPP